MEQPQLQQSMGTTKQLLRKQMREKLNQLAAIAEGQKQIAAESEAIQQELLTHPWLLKANRLSIYVGTDKEVGTDAIIKWAMQQGKQVFIPRFKVGKDPMEMLRLESEAQFDSLPTTIWGIRQHPIDGKFSTYCDGCENENPLDLIILPGLAFTTDGKRLGHGRGHYDRFLSEYAQRHGQMPKTVGLALSAQIVEDLPMEAWDRHIDQVIVCDLNSDEIKC